MAMTRCSEGGRPSRLPPTPTCATHLKGLVFVGRQAQPAWDHRCGCTEGCAQTARTALGKGGGTNDTRRVTQGT